MYYTKLINNSEYINYMQDLMRSKNTSGYFSFYIDNRQKHIPLEIFLKFPLNPN